MIDFQPFSLSRKTEYESILMRCGMRSCEYSFANLYLWGQQKVAFLSGHLVFFSQFGRKSVYLYPVGQGDKKAVLEAILADAAERGILCRLTGLGKADCEELENLYPNRFCFYPDRDSYDYVYEIEALATLKGKKYQKKRNQLNRFFAAHPDHRAVPITEENESRVRQMVEKWYLCREAEDPTADYHLEKKAIFKALERRRELGMEGYALEVGGEIVAMSMASALNETMFDVHFEKALDRSEGVYAAVNYYFSRYLHEKYGAVKYLNREDDMGIEGLRRAKLSYHPEQMIEKAWACVREDDDAN